jgi:hypothetical protein
MGASIVSVFVYRPSPAPRIFLRASSISSATPDARPAKALGSVPTDTLSFPMSFQTDQG